MLRAQLPLRERIKSAQDDDPELKSLKEKSKEGVAPDFQISDDGTLYLKRRLCVPKIEEIKRQILRDAHNFKFSVHLGSIKMYRT